MEIESFVLTVAALIVPSALALISPEWAYLMLRCYHRVVVFIVVRGARCRAFARSEFAVVLGSIQESIARQRADGRSHLGATLRALSAHLSELQPLALAAKARSDASLARTNSSSGEKDLLEEMLTRDSMENIRDILQVGMIATAPFVFREHLGNLYPSFLVGSLLISVVELVSLLVDYRWRRQQIRWLREQREGAIVESAVGEQAIADCGASEAPEDQTAR